jgi:exosortase
VDEQSTTGILDEFQGELVEAWRQLPNKGFFFFLLAAWLLLFQFLGNSTFGYMDTPSLLNWIYMLGSAKSGEGETDDNQMLIAPLIVIGLFWWKRKELLKQPMSMWWQGLLLVGLGLLLHIVGYRVQQPRISIVAMFTGIYGLMGMAWGPKFLRASIFPFFLFIFCVPFGTLSEFITVPLRHIVARIVEDLTRWAPHWMHLQIIRQGTQLIDPDGNFQYEVAAACGGIRSLIMTTMLAIVFGFTVFRSAWKRILLIALAVPLAVAGNVLRLLVVMVASKWVSRGFGMWLHDNAITSLLPYVPAVLVLLWLGNLLERKKNPPAEMTTPTPEVPATSEVSS